MELIEKVLDGGTISLTCGEQNEPGRRMRVQAGSCLLPHLGTEALSRGTGRCYGAGDEEKWQLRRFI